MADGNRGSSSLGMRWGFALTLVVAIPLLSGLFLFAALSDCVPGDGCYRDGPSLRLVLAALLIAVGIGFGTRLLVNLAFHRVGQIAADEERSQEPRRSDD